MHIDSFCWVFLGGFAPWREQALRWKLLTFYPSFSRAAWECLPSAPRQTRKTTHHFINEAHTNKFSGLNESLAQRAQPSYHAARGNENNEPSPP